MADCMDAVCQRRQTLVVFKRAVQLCIIGVFPVWVAILLFPVVGRCCSHFTTLSLNSWRSITQHYRWNFDAIYRSSRDTSISGLGDHIAISGCRSCCKTVNIGSVGFLAMENPYIDTKINILYPLLKELWAFSENSVNSVLGGRVDFCILLWMLSKHMTRTFRYGDIIKERTKYGNYTAFCCSMV